MSDIEKKEKVAPASEYEAQRMENLTLATVAHKMAGEIQTDAQYVEASEFLIKIKERRRWWEKLINPAIEAAHAAHKRMIAVKKEVDMPLERAENEILKPALLKFSEKKEAERRAAEEKLNRLMAEEAEKKRKEEEAAQRKTYEEAEAKRKEEEAEVARQAAARGEPIPEPAAPLPPPPPPPPAPPVQMPTIVLPKTEDPKGISYVTIYVAEVTDLSALLQAVINGVVPIEAIQPNMSFINNRAKTLKNLMAWPGIVVKEERGVRATSGR